MSWQETLADRLILTVQVLSFVGAALCLLGIFFPPSGEVAGGGYQYTYPDGTIASPIAEYVNQGPNFGDVLWSLVSAIFLLSMGTVLFCLRRIGMYLRGQEA